MIAYLLKFILCSSLFYLIYHLLLEKESMHRFKRFYLLFTLVASLVIPVTPSIHSYALKPAATIHQSVDQKIAEFGSWIVPQEHTDVTPIAYQPQESTSNPLAAIMIVFGFISFLLFVRYLMNIVRIKRSGQKHQIPKKYDQANLALIKNLPASYSFWNTIFLNKNNYETNEIDPKILTHELIHVKQKHTADVLFIEWLLTLFWFNPALYLYRRAIKLNHEFLADEGVVQQTDQVFEHQTILLNQASGNSHAFASSFNYLITKKRLIMMTKKTSAKKILLSMLFVIPCSFLIASSLGKFKKDTDITTAEFIIDQAQTEAPQNVEKKDPKAPVKATLHYHPPGKEYGKGISNEEMNEYESIVKKYTNTDGGFKGIEEKITDNDRERLKALYEQMDKVQQGKQRILVLPKLPPLKKMIPSQEAYESWKKADVYGVWIDGKKIDNSELNKYKNTDFNHFHVSFLYPNAKKGKSYDYQVDLQTIEYFAESVKRNEKRKSPIYERIQGKDKDEFYLSPAGIELR